MTLDPLKNNDADHDLSALGVLLAVNLLRVAVAAWPHRTRDAPKAEPGLCWPTLPTTDSIRDNDGPFRLFALPCCCFRDSGVPSKDGLSLSVTSAPSAAGLFVLFRNKSCQISLSPLCPPPAHGSRRRVSTISPSPPSTTTALTLGVLRLYSAMPELARPWALISPEKPLFFCLARLTMDAAPLHFATRGWPGEGAIHLGSSIASIAPMLVPAFRGTEVGQGAPQGAGSHGPARSNGGRPWTSSQAAHATHPSHPCLPIVRRSPTRRAAFAQHGLFGAIGVDLVAAD
ncbi:hypothetical protein CDD83_740 [Cordyceps sp. RAO-2017]|nr:hypothetical protein CDD83_740 [Cordyceps sp. RAO-2017]